MQADRERRRERRSAPKKRPLDRFRDSRRTVWILAVVGVVLVWVLSGFLLRALSSGEVISGTSMRGVELGGETRVGAAKLIDEIEPARTKLRGGQQTIGVRAPQAGLVIDSTESAERAYEAGRTGVGSILKGPLFLLTDREVDPVYEPIKEKRLSRTVNRVADKVDREPFVGALSIDPATLEVTTEQPEAGVVVRRDATKEQLLDTLRAGDPSMKIPTRKQAAPTPAEVKSVALSAEQYLDEPVTIRTAGGPAEFTPRQMAPVLAIQSTDDGIHLGADKEKLASLVADFAGERDIAAKDAGLDTPAAPPVTLTTQGDVSWQPKPGAATVTKARTGRQILQEKAVENMSRAIRDDRHQVRFPTKVVKPNVTNNAMKGANSLLGTFTTSYPCCEPRVTNIQTIAKTVDGTVIGPGEQFSLNGIAGERTKAKGYKSAPTIGEANKLVDSVGGGVSQFSTTMYNAAYFAGLQIDAHTPHSFYISRYPAGRESTLNYGSIDLLWTNNTDSPVIVRSSADDTSVTASIYGGNGGRKVKAETQSRSGTGDGGFDITIDRVVINPDGTRLREPFTTNYGVPGD